MQPVVLDDFRVLCEIRIDLWFGISRVHTPGERDVFFRSTDFVLAESAIERELGNGD